MLDIVNELYLLLLDAHKGSFFLRNQYRIARGLAGAVLGDLVMTGRIRVHPDQMVETTRFLYSENLLRDSVLSQIIAEKPRTIQEWLQTIEIQGQEFVNQVTSDLVRQGTIRFEESSYLGFFPHHVSIPTDPNSVYWIVLNLRAVALYCEPPTPQTVFLLQLLVEMGLAHRVFERDEIRLAMKAIPPLDWTRLMHPKSEYISPEWDPDFCWS